MIRLLNDPAVEQATISPRCKTIQSGGQRLQPEVRLLARRLIPSAFVQENFGMSEGLLMFVRRNDPEDVRLETVGRPVCPDDEVRLLDDDDNDRPVRAKSASCAAAGPTRCAATTACPSTTRGSSPPTGSTARAI